MFKPLKRSSNNTFIPIIATYIVSSLLHGFNFQVASVLLTLGCLTFLEFKTREKLAAIYNCCSLSRPCPKSLSGNNRCLNGHSNDYKIIGITINMLFWILSIVHLAYLGSTFDGKEDSASVNNVVSVWSELGFYSHIIGFLNLIVYLIIQSV